DLAVDDERYAAGERGGAVQRERAEPSVRHLLLHDTARPDEDRGGASLVDRNARAGDLRARCAAQLDHLARRIDDDDDDAAALLTREGIGRCDNGVGALVVDDPAGTKCT